VDQISGLDKLSGASTIPSFFGRDFKVVDSGSIDRLAVSPKGPSSLGSRTRITMFEKAVKAFLKFKV